MADDLSLLFKLRADNASANKAIAETRAAVSQLRQSFGSDLAAMQGASSTALTEIGNGLNVFIGQRIPLVGGAFVRVTENLKNLGSESANTEKDLAKFGKTIENISTSTGRSAAEIRTFLTSFVQIEGQAARDAEAIEHFGAATAQTLIPQLEQAGSEFSALAASSGEASEGLAGVLASMGPVGIAAAGIAVEVVGAAIAMGVLVKTGESVIESFFDMAKSAAGFRGELFDLSQQTGVSVETLNALGIVASETGGSIESIAQSLVIFQGKLDEAQDSGSKTGQVFARLGITTHDTESAFRSALAALAKMPEGFHQTNEAAELFGRRGGKQVLAILKETDGDIDSVVSRLGDLAKVTREDARISDEFNDRLRDLQIQFRGLVGKEAIPAATDALKELSKLLKENHILVDALGGAVRLFGLGIKGGFVDPIVAALNLLAPVLTRTAEYWERIAAAMQLVTGRGLTVDPNAIPALANTGVGPVPEIGGTATANLPGPKTKKGPSGHAAAEKAFAAELKAAALTEREAQQIIDENIAENHRARDEQIRDIEEFTAREKKLLDDRLNAIIDRVNAEAEANENGLRRKLITQAEFSNRDRELTLETKKAVQENSEEIFRLEQDRDRKKSEAELAAGRRSDQIAEEAAQRQIDRIKKRIDSGLLLESEGEQQVATIVAEGYQRRKEALEKENAAYATSLERRAAITDELIRLDGERAKSAEDAAQRIIKAQSDELQSWIDKQNEIEDAKANLADRPDNRPTGAIDQLFLAIDENLDGTQHTAALAGLQAMTEAFQGLGQAVGQVVESFVLYGSAGTSVRKVTAEILAGIAKQAAIKAVFELAEGFAALALAFFGLPNAGPSATAHFTAAGIYAGIAGIAAVAGRGVAGDAFQQKSGSSSSSASNGSPERPSAPAPRDINRNGQSIVVHIHGEAAAAFNYKVVDAVIQDHRLNGPIRTMIVHDET